jgi:hypothetical protein
MPDKMLREASCACGELRIMLTGDPELVSSCACRACQRRTGSAYGLTAFFREDQVAGQSGEAQLWSRTGESGKALLFRFCPNCGTTVWWTPEAKPGYVAVGGGCFADREFPAPSRLIWTDFGAAWLRPPEGAPTYPRGPN